MLDYGFAGWAVKTADKEEEIPKRVEVVKGARQTVDIITKGNFSALVEKNKLNLVEKQVTLPRTVDAPVKKGQKIGCIEYTLNGDTVGKVDIVATDKVKKMNPVIMFWELMGKTVSFAF